MYMIGAAKCLGGRERDGQGGGEERRGEERRDR